MSGQTRTWRGAFWPKTVREISSGLRRSRWSLRSPRPGQGQLEAAHSSSGSRASRLQPPPLPGRAVQPLTNLDTGELLSLQQWAQAGREVARGPCAFVGMTLRCAALPCTPHPHRGQERQWDVVPRQTEGLPVTGEHLLPARQACLYNINKIFYVIEAYYVNLSWLT